MSNISRRTHYCNTISQTSNDVHFFSSCIQTLPILRMKKTNFTLCAADDTQKTYCNHTSCKSFWCVLQIHCPLVYLVCASILFCIASFPTSLAFLVASYITSPVLLLNVLTPSFNLSCFHHHDPKRNTLPTFSVHFASFS